MILLHVFLRMRYRAVAVPKLVAAELSHVYIALN